MNDCQASPATAAWRLLRLFFNGQRPDSAINNARLQTSKRLVPQDAFAGGYMKSLSGTLLALAFVCFTLLSLHYIIHTWEDAFLQLGDNESKISEPGLRFNRPP